ncbi:hypothetical protein V1264_023474 [Littorina saxatilis]|uniref:TATA box-binding protein-like 1 n=2 Tax=Littorina saxatilis TaxID=31220 RepID=A0AAN9B865_9CAEN
MPDSYSFTDSSTSLADSHTLHVTEEENKENKVENLKNKDVSEVKEEHPSNAGNEEQGAEGADTPVIDIVVNNVVCTFNLRCHINLKRLAMEGSNVEYRREHGILNMKLRRPRVTSNITSSGKVTITGSTSEGEARVAARRVARRLQRLGFNVRFFHFKVVNVLATCSLPFGIKLNTFSNQYPQEASYEPELHPGVTFRIKDPKATLKIFSTGSITITAPCVDNIGSAVEHIYPLVSEYQMEKRVIPKKNLNVKKIEHSHHYHPHHGGVNGFHGDEDEDDELDEEEEEMYDSDDDSFDSDVSHD